ADRRPSVLPPLQNASLDRARPVFARRADRNLPWPNRQLHPPRALGSPYQCSVGCRVPGDRWPAAPPEPDLRGAARRTSGLRHPLRAHANGRSAPSWRHHRRLRHRLWRGSNFQRILSRSGSASRRPRTRADDGHGPVISSDPRGGWNPGVELSAERLVMNELLDEIRAMIAERGPITIEQYMQLALSHPDFGYYMNRDPFGATGDFTTAP